MRNVVNLYSPVYEDGISLYISQNMIVRNPLQFFVPHGIAVLCAAALAA